LTPAPLASPLPVTKNKAPAKHGKATRRRR
jgi:hypothetical protein